MKRPAAFTIEIEPSPNASGHTWAWIKHDGCYVAGQPGRTVQEAIDRALEYADKWNWTPARATAAVAS